jgi:hypothetical protein
MAIMFAPAVPTVGSDFPVAGFTRTKRPLASAAKGMFPRGWDWPRGEWSPESDLTPAQARRQTSCLAVLLVAFNDITTALKGAIAFRAREDAKTQFDEDLRGILCYVRNQAGTIEDNSPPTVWGFAEMKGAERQLAFVRGEDGCCGCYALRGLRAIEKAESIISSVIARLDRAGDGDCWLAQDAAAWIWMVNIFSDLYGMSVKFQNSAAKLAFCAEIEAKYPPRTSQTETEAATA